MRLRRTFMSSLARPVLLLLLLLQCVVSAVCVRPPEKLKKKLVSIIIRPHQFETAANVVSILFGLINLRRRRTLKLTGQSISVF